MASSQSSSSAPVSHKAPKQVEAVKGIIDRAVKGIVDREAERARLDAICKVHEEEYLKKENERFKEYMAEFNQKMHETHFSGNPDVDSETSTSNRLHGDDVFMEVVKKLIDMRQQRLRALQAQSSGGRAPSTDGTERME